MRGKRLCAEAEGRLACTVYLLAKRSFATLRVANCTPNILASCAGPSAAIRQGQDSIHLDRCKHRLYCTAALPSQTQLETQLTTNEKQVTSEFEVLTELLRYYRYMQAYDATFHMHKGSACTKPSQMYTRRILLRALLKRKCQ